MTTIDEARSALVGAANVLMKRRGSTTDPQETEVIDQAIDEINAKIGILNQAGLLQAAQAVATAADLLEKVVASARLGPFDSYLSEIEGSIKRLSDVQGRMHETESLASAEVAGGSPGVESAAATADGLPGLSKPIDSKIYTELQQQYQDYYAACKLRPEYKDNVGYYVGRLTKYEDTYAAVGVDLGIPWQFIGIIHALEAGFNFNAHLHNGDPLSARTVHVPAGRPQIGDPPFTWKESARDALMLEGYHHETDWTVPRMLYLWEKYNGMGYRPLGIPTPYLWSFSNIYTMGKYVQDGHFDPTAVSKQCGAAVMLKALS